MACHSSPIKPDGARADSLAKERSLTIESSELHNLVKPNLTETCFSSLVGHHSTSVLLSYWKTGWLDIVKSESKKWISII